ncbi:MAG: hypothetical protein ACR2RE_15195 [Geminicoccaceae bacterium]
MALRETEFGTVRIDEVEDKIPVMKPLFARILLERPKADKIGSIILPDQERLRHASMKCKVLAKGPTADESVRVGAYVLVGQHAGAWLNAKGKPVTNPSDADFFICQDEDILLEFEDG